MTLDTVGEGLRDDINSRTTNFVATYASPLLTIERQWDREKRGLFYYSAVDTSRKFR